MIAGVHLLPRSLEFPPSHWGHCTPSLSPGRPATLPRLGILAQRIASRSALGAFETTFTP